MQIKFNCPFNKINFFHLHTQKWYGIAQHYFSFPTKDHGLFVKKTLFSFCLTYKISKFAEHVNLSIPVMKKFFLFILNLLLLTACGNRTQTSDKPLIMVSIEPLRYFTEIIAGDKFEVESMVPEGSNPEFYDPTPQQIISLTKSKAFLRIGFIGFEQTWTDRLQKNSPDTPFFDLSENVDLIYEDNSSQQHHAHIHGIEPHIWSSTQNAYIIARNICNALCSIDQTNAGFYKKNLEILIETIRETDQIVRTYLQKAHHVFLIYHPALSYFARDYGLTQLCIEKDGKEPSPAYLQKLIHLCEEKNVGVIFIQQEFDTRNATLIAQELNIPSIQINPLNYKWKDELIHIAKSLTEKN